MVSNSKDDHPSKATPITNRVPVTHPGTVMQADIYFPSSEGGEKSKQPMAHKGIQSDEVYSWIPLSYCFHFGA